MAGKDSITDVSMPELTGIDMVRQLRAQPEFENVPILVLTAFGKEEMDQAIRWDEVRELLAESGRQ